MTLATLKDVVQPALTGGCAVGGLVTLGWEDMRAFVHAAEAEGLPVILQAGPSGRAHTPLPVLGKMFRTLADSVSVPVVAHLDHGYTFDDCKEALDSGFTSLMYDGCRKPLAQNIDETARDPSPPPESYIAQSGGVCRDMMIHDFDMARFLLGEDPVEVFATGSCLVDPEIGAEGDVDTAAVTLKTASGKNAIINNSRRATYGYDQWIEVHGAEGMLKAANALEHLVEQAGVQGGTTAPSKHFFLERYEAAYVADMETFIAALERGSAVSPSMYHGVAAQRLADATAQLLASGQPVRLG